MKKSFCTDQVREGCLYTPGRVPEGVSIPGKKAFLGYHPIEEAKIRTGGELGLPRRVLERASVQARECIRLGKELGERDMVTARRVSSRG